MNRLEQRPLVSKKLKDRRDWKMHTEFNLLVQLFLFNCKYKIIKTQLKLAQILLEGIGWAGGGLGRRSFY